MSGEDLVTAKGIDLYRDVAGNKPFAGVQKQEKGKPWSVLKTCNAAFDGERIQKEAILFSGGFQMNRPEVARLFAPQLVSEESSEAYKDRIASAAYTPTFTKLITGLISNLFSEDLAVMEAADHDDPATAGEEFSPVLRDFYKAFESDCDAHGKSIHNFFRELTEKGLVHQYAYFGLDYPSVRDIDLSVISLLEQERLGLDQPFLYHIDNASVVDWQMQAGSDKFQWLKLRSEVPFQASPFDPALIQVEIKAWMMSESGVASFEIYRSRPVERVEDLSDKEILPLIEEGETTFDRIPIFCLHFNDGIAVGKKLAPMAAELFARKTLENHATNRACITVPVLFRGDILPESSGSPGIPNPSMLDLQRGDRPKARVNSNGIVELGDKTRDDFRIVESEAKALAFIHKQNEDLDDAMHSVIHQMGQSQKNSQGKSATSAKSKQEDRHAMEMLLTAIANVVFDMVDTVFDCIARTRGEDIIFEVQGLSAVSRNDRDVLVTECQFVLPAIGAIQSPTFHKEYQYRIGSNLVEGIGQETLKTIRMEIEQGVDALPIVSPQEKYQNEQDAQKDAMQKPPVQTAT